MSNDPNDINNRARQLLATVSIHAYQRGFSGELISSALATWDRGTERRTLAFAYGLSAWFAVVAQSLRSGKSGSNDDQLTRALLDAFAELRGAA